MGWKGGDTWQVTGDPVTTPTPHCASSLPYTLWGLLCRTRPVQILHAGPPAPQCHCGNTGHQTCVLLPPKRSTSITCTAPTSSSKRSKRDVTGRLLTQGANCGSASLCAGPGCLASCLAQKLGAPPDPASRPVSTVREQRMDLRLTQSHSPQSCDWPRGPGRGALCAHHTQSPFSMVPAQPEEARGVAISWTDHAPPSPGSHGQTE